MQPTLLTHCLQSQWTFLLRSIQQLPSCFSHWIRSVFISALFRRDVNDLERDLLSLPARMGGMGICKPTEECLTAHSNSTYVSTPLVRLIQRQELRLTLEISLVK